ncbi:E3 ubiquitin-protein ligase RNF130 (G1-related zinc finger protein) (Goliath homolog) (RING finger protein 130) (RING-type E3 ubiquitin transferase RNF130) [Durusdinium trenchii]|uniref:RING-type E3 ubiquitin transferase n=1 Tax=Durusdinium trenchii TaxID=1381693 RepID=A0ABP0RHN6_9DINO
MAFCVEDDVQVVHVKSTARRKASLREPSAPLRKSPRHCTTIDLDRAECIDLSKRARGKVKKPSVSMISRKRKAVAQVQPIKVDLEDEDQVIETCTSYEEAFLGYKPKGSTFPTLSPPVMVPSCLLPLVPSQASQMTPAPVQPVDRTARPKRPRLEVIHQASSESPQMPRMEAAEVGIFSQDQTISEAPSESESFADLPKEFLLPDAPAEAKAPVVPEPVQPPPATPATFDEEAEESLPAVPYSQAYVERLRNNAEEDCCCICRKVFIADQVRLGYTPHNGNEARWLHLRCLADDGLQMELGDWLAFSPGIGVEERQRVLTILSIRRPMRPMDSHTGPLSWSPRLWCHCPAISQRWPRCRVPRAGATRAAPRLNLRYVAPVLSTVSQQARAVLLRERHRRLQAAGRQVVPPVPLARRPASGPSAVARRAQVTASSRRPNTQVEPVAETETRSGRRQWQRRSALGERAKELFAVAPVVCLEKDRSEEEPCVICHESLLAGDEVRRLPCCHTFHRSCIDRWLRLKAVCPLDKLTVDQMLSQPCSERRPAEGASSRHS